MSTSAPSADVDADDLWSEYRWCVCCHRGYHASRCRLDGGIRWCAYDSCGGAFLTDGWDWNLVRTAHPEFPEQPVWGVRYQVPELI